MFNSFGGSPLALLLSLIFPSHKNFAIPGGDIMSIRRYAIIFSLLAFGLGLYEVCRFGPLEESYVLIWALMIFVGGLINTIGAFML